MLLEGRVISVLIRERNLRAEWIKERGGEAQG